MGQEYRIKVALPSREDARRICTQAGWGLHVKEGADGADFHATAPASPSEWPEASLYFEAEGFLICLHANSDVARQVFGRVVQMAAGEGVVTVEEL